MWLASTQRGVLLFLLQLERQLFLCGFFSGVVSVISIVSIFSFPRLSLSLSLYLSLSFSFSLSLSVQQYLLLYV